MGVDLKSGEALRASRFNVQRTVEGRFTLGNTYSGAMISVPDEEEATVRAALRGVVSTSITDEVTQRLFDLGFLVRVSTNELRKVHVAHSWLNRDSKAHVIVMPTEDCNFRCIYCYESFTKKAMNPEIRERVKRYLSLTIPKLQSFELAWFGGEPLFAFDVMREIGEHAKDLCNTHGVAFHTSITTNAYLLGEAELRFLKGTNTTHFQITVDGAAEAHDRSRPLNGGGATFDQVWNNLLRLREGEEHYHVYVRVNVHKENVESAKALTDKFIEAFGSDRRFVLDFHSVWGYGEHGRDVDLLGDAKRAMKTLKIEALEKAERNCIMFDPFGLGTQHCYAGKSNSIVIGSDASIYKCTVAFDDPRNRVGSIDSNGYLSVDDDLWAMWTADDYRNDSECQKCFYVPSCLGSSCPLVRIQSGNRPCPSLKTDIGGTMSLVDALFASSNSTQTIPVDQIPSS